MTADALCRIIQVELSSLHRERSCSKQSRKDVKPPMLMTQNRGSQSQYFSSWLRILINVHVVFTSINKQSCSSSLRSAIFNNLESRVVYKPNCSGNTFTCVGETVPHWSIRIEEHNNPYSPVGRYFFKKNVDSSFHKTKLLTLEAKQIRTK